MWSSGWEDALFKRAPEGLTFNSPYPRIFSQRRWTYLLTDVEKERLAGRLRRFLPLVQALVLGVCVLAAVPLAFWLPLPDLVRQLVVGSPGARLLLSLVMLALTLRIGVNRALSYDRSRVVHHTDRGSLQRHVQSDIVFHRSSPSLQGLWGWPDCFWRADSQSLNMARSRNYPMLIKSATSVSYWGF